METLSSLKRFDIFGYPVSLSSQNKTTHTTKLGGFLTILMLSFFVIVGITSLYKLFRIELIGSTNFTQKLGAHYGSLPLGVQSFMLAVKFNVEAINNFTNPYMNVSFVQTTQSRINNSIVKLTRNINLKACTSDHFKGLESQFFSLGLNTALCPEIGSNLTIQGGFTEDSFTYLKVKIFPCSDNIKCQSLQAFNKTVGQNSRFGVDFYILNNYVDENNIDNPITAQISSDMHFLVNPLQPYYGTADIFMSDMYVNTDRSFFPSLTNDVNVQRTYTFKQEISQQSMFTYSKDSYGDFYFRKSQTTYHYNRTIGKFLEILSYLGGIWSTVYIVLSITIRAYARYDFINALANKLYEYPSETRKKNGNSHKGLSAENNEKSALGSKENIIKKIEEHLSYDRTLRIGFWTILKYVFSPFCFCLRKNKKVILLGKSEENLMKDLDICTILTKIQKLDAMRKVLFDPDQEFILGYYPKTSIKVEERPKIQREIYNGRRRSSKKNFMGTQIDFDSNVKNYENLVNCWNNLKKNQEFPVNDRIIKMFDEELKRIFSTNQTDVSISQINISMNSLENFENIDEKKHNNDEIGLEPPSFSEKKMHSNTKFF